MRNKLIMATAVVLPTTNLTACSGANNDTQGGTTVTKSSKRASRLKIKLLQNWRHYKSQQV
ncbi:hypothetical protein [Lactobacillus sp. B4026]|uniref:hypothetical protein n=1 Tax=Lactobacillus sp. B4026 TaxID=2818035 RepID=UPI00226B456F|nr:hypothetical protein [Lactobacillus sp. B4026]MCX8737407.1 hypothetical protein [Lactobacillus sp. B4026]